MVSVRTLWGIPKESIACAIRGRELIASQYRSDSRRAFLEILILWLKLCSTSQEWWGVTAYHSSIQGTHCLRILPVPFTEQCPWSMPRGYKTHLTMLNPWSSWGWLSRFSLLGEQVKDCVAFTTCLLNSFLFGAQSTSAPLQKACSKAKAFLRVIFRGCCTFSYFWTSLYFPANIDKSKEGKREQGQRYFCKKQISFLF